MKLKVDVVIDKETIGDMKDSIEYQVVQHIAGIMWQNADIRKAVKKTVEQIEKERTKIIDVTMADMNKEEEFLKKLADRVYVKLGRMIMSDNEFMQKIAGLVLEKINEQQ